MGWDVDEVAKVAPSKVVRPAEERPTTPDVSGKESVDAQSLAGIFGVRSSELSPKEVEKINSLVSWVKSLGGDKDDLDIAWALVQKRNQLGSPRVGTSVIDHMYQWYKASQDVQSAEQRLREVELGNV